MRNEIVPANVPKVAVRAGDRSTYAAPGFVCDLHFHEELEFLPVYSGVFVCTVGGKDYVAHAGEVVFVGSGIPHETRCEQADTSVALLQFREKDFAGEEAERVVRYSAKLRTAAGAPARVLKEKDYFDTVTAILDETSAGKPAGEMFIRSGLLRLLGLLYRDRILQDPSEMYGQKEVQKILPALEFINEHYAEPIDLVTVSGKLGFDPSYFCRIFKQAIGATFTEYLGFVRISKAERRLTRTSDPIVDIATDVGISSVSYFNRLFRKYHNCTPSYFRTAVYSNM